MERKRPLWRPRQKLEGNTVINLKKNVMKIWTELMWLRAGLSGWCLCTSWWTIRLRKIFYIYRQGERLVASQEEFRCMELVNAPSFEWKILSIFIWIKIGLLSVLHVHCWQNVKNVLHTHTCMPPTNTQVSVWKICWVKCWLAPNKKIVDLFTFYELCLKYSFKT